MPDKFMYVVKLDFDIIGVYEQPETAIEEAKEIIDYDQDQKSRDFKRFEQAVLTAAETGIEDAELESPTDPTRVVVILFKKLLD